jgi:hypothetical protein
MSKVLNEKLVAVARKIEKAFGIPSKRINWYSYGRPHHAQEEMYGVLGGTKNTGEWLRFTIVLHFPSYKWKEWKIEYYRTEHYRTAATNWICQAPGIMTAHARDTMQPWVDKLKKGKAENETRGKTRGSNKKVH